MNKNNGGPAYPIPPIVIGDKLFDESSSTGMSLRDAFAIAALPQAINVVTIRNSADPHSIAAIIAYQFADAMLAEREK